MRGEVRVMSKLIYADSLRQDILALPNCYNGFSDTYDKACIIGVIDEQQPVDAVPVVRCKDCKHYDIEIPSRCIKDRCYCATVDSFMKTTDFCSYAERRNNED